MPMTSKGRLSIHTQENRWKISAWLWKWGQQTDNCSCGCERKSDGRDKLPKDKMERCRAENRMMIYRIWKRQGVCVTNKCPAVVQGDTYCSLFSLMVRSAVVDKWSKSAVLVAPALRGLNSCELCSRRCSDVRPGSSRLREGAQTVGRGILCVFGETWHTTSAGDSPTATEVKSTMSAVNV